ncbi:MAG: AmmeMemoRadiSam system protein B [Candidatus Marinimicrobia bacterium]|nr:AmmeMemoRadiSam system protein B [Candidatus Neomarinimicrobiota bacterium]
MERKIRTPAVAGTFYPEDEKDLTELIQKCLPIGDIPEPDSDLISLVAPHAGIVYSGQVAGFAYNLLKDKKKQNILILAPSHHEYFAGGTLYDGDAYATPLGEVPINSDLSQKISDSSKHIKFSPIGHEKEHSLEVQLPFLQEVLKNDFNIIPLIIGNINLDIASEIAESIAGVISAAEEDVLLIASTDLSHFHDQERAKVLDNRTAEYLESMSIDMLYNECENGNCEACGINPLAVVIKASQLLGASNVDILKYATSGDVSGDYKSVVGYLSAAIRA